MQESLRSQTADEKGRSFNMANAEAPGDSPPTSG